MEETPSAAVDATPLRPARPIAWTSAVLISATLTLAVFNARAAPAWIASQAPTPETIRLHDAAQAWAGTTARLGLDRPGEAVRALWARRREVRVGKWGAADDGVAE